MPDPIKNLVNGFKVAWARHDMEHGGCFDFDADQLEAAFRKIEEKAFERGREWERNL